MANGKAMVAEAEAAGRTLMVSQNYRYKAAPRAVARILAEPWLGAVTRRTVEFRKAPHFSLPDVQHGYAHYKLIEDMSIHHFDLMRAVLHDEPAAVYAQARNPEWSWFAAPPIVSAVIELAERRARPVPRLLGVARAPDDVGWRLVHRLRARPGGVGRQPRPRATRGRLLHRVPGGLPGARRLDGVRPPGLRRGGAPVHARGVRVAASPKGAGPATSGRDNLRSIALTYAVADSAADRPAPRARRLPRPERSHA